MRPPASRAVADIRTHNSSEQAAAINACYPMMIIWQMVAIMQITPNGGTPTVLAKMDWFPW
jgi:hypothetical protein